MKKLIAVAALAAFASSQAQEKAAPPPMWQQGRPPEMGESKLAPFPPKLTETAPADIPVDKIKLPTGFKVELWAHGLPGGREMARGAKGKIYLGTRQIGRVYEVTDQGGKRTVRIVAEKLLQPAGVAFADGSLYVAAIDKVLRYDGIEDKPDVAPVDVTQSFKLPPEAHHQWKYLAFGPDKKLYVPFGAPCNICEPPEQYAQIRRYNPDGSGMEVIARGIRNSIGFDWHPKTGELWFTDNGRDWMGEEGPEDELNRVTRVGLNFGFPYCHANGIPDPQFKKEDPCKGVTMPVALLGPHAAALGMIFYTGVPGRVQEHHLHRAQGFVEPHQALRLRHRERRGSSRWQECQGEAVHDRLHGSPGEQILGPTCLSAADARRRVARLRRAERRDLPRELSQVGKLLLRWCAAQVPGAGGTSVPLHRHSKRSSVRLTVSDAWTASPGAQAAAHLVSISTLIGGGAAVP